MPAYFRIRSWHVLRGYTSSGRLLALCGRTAPSDAETADLLPGDRSCESCLRIAERR